MVEVECSWGLYPSWIWFSSSNANRFFASKFNYFNLPIANGFLRSVCNPCGRRLKAKCVGALDFCHSKCHLCLFKWSTADKPCRYKLSRAAGKLPLRGNENCLNGGWLLGWENLVSLQRFILVALHFWGTRVWNGVQRDAECVYGLSGIFLNSTTHWPRNRAKLNKFFMGLKMRIWIHTDKTSRQDCFQIQFVLTVLACPCG